MIQGGDPTGEPVCQGNENDSHHIDELLLGTGKGGQSIWGRPFPDEVRQTLRVSLSDYV